MLENLNNLIRENARLDKDKDGDVDFQDLKINVYRRRRTCG
jgi:hypothetical protein